MKLFQIEEPEGAPEGPGVAVGIDLDAVSGCAVAIAVGGNGELLPDGDGMRRLGASGLVRAARYDAAVLTEMLRTLRGQAEKQLARPVTHAVIAASPLDAAAQGAIEEAATAAGIAVLRLVDRATAAAGGADEDAAVLGAAVLAEDLAPRPGED